ncbi:hypothetical protein ACFWHQ_33795 [Streptomyces sp. NPDC060334]|uniref:hypothetical protein n=1 Tax=unclassified Streptomyces TaxID=2593676 RepID=UPI003322DCBA
MRRLRVLVVAFLTVPALALAGCGGHGSPRSLPSDPLVPSTTTSSAAAPTPTPSPTPTPTPTPSPTPTCTVTSGMGPDEKADYLKALRSKDRPDYSALFMTDTGVYLSLKDGKRPCEAVEVKISHFRVDMTRATSKPGYSHSYKPINTVVVKVGPRDGFAPGSVPPPPQGCGGTLSVLYVGDEITEDDLPDELRLPSADSSIDWTLVVLTADRALDGVFQPPAGVRDC